MLTYRVYFRAFGKIAGREDFEAEDDLSAIRIARVLYDRCSDACTSFEQLQGTRLIPARQAHHEKANLADLIEAHQRVVIEREAYISQSRWSIAQSRSLIETLDRANQRREWWILNNPFRGIAVWLDL